MEFEEFTVIGPIHRKETIAHGRGVKARDRLNRLYGHGRWRKLKADATILVKKDGSVRHAEIHWYEAHGIGAPEGKIKYFLD
jgi:hypothetical protein